MNLAPLGDTNVEVWPDAYGVNDFAFTGPYTQQGDGNALRFQFYLVGGPGGPAQIRCALYTKSTEGPNLEPNGTFDGGSTAGWEGFPDGRQTETLDYIEYGSAAPSVKVTCLNPAAGYYGYYSWPGPILVNPARTYLARTRIRVPVGTAVDFELDWYSDPAASTAISENNVHVVGNDEWQTVELGPLSPPAGAASSLIGFYSGAGAGHYFNIDDVELHEVTATPVWHLVPDSMTDELVIPTSAPGAWYEMPIPGMPALTDGVEYWMAMWFGPGWPFTGALNTKPNYREEYGLGYKVWWDGANPVTYSPIADPPATKAAPQSYDAKVSIYVESVGPTSSINYGSMADEVQPQITAPSFVPTTDVPLTGQDALAELQIALETFPSQIDLVVTAPEQEPVGRSWAFDWHQHAFVSSLRARSPKVTAGHETLKGWIEKCLRTARGAHAIHPTGYGIMPFSRPLIGSRVGEVPPDLEDRIRDALLFHPKINDVTNFQYAWGESGEDYEVAFDIVLDDSTLLSLQGVRVNNVF